MMDTYEWEVGKVHGGVVDFPGVLAMVFALFTHYLEVDAFVLWAHAEIVHHLKQTSVLAEVSNFP